ncbi:cell envelope integrity protein CreD [Undibacterium fentianense]|uniref:Cell envelope integrity protein CreD n=1 Tax=Undibacterium fentianense TaxID=2828728 RepID=A0A941E310_9BURK|nr:cell envelope integrity protein CreD [Undibacterium fentianense]MBR7800541.1 cell envelope integrity protein CreD [Undibacterium fentianense]
MQRALFFKLFTIGLLMLVIGIPLVMIENTINARLRYRDDAVRSIAADSVGQQSLLGPVMIIPYSEYYEEEEIVDVPSKRSVQRQRVLHKRLFVFPNELKMLSNLDTDQRYRGIHKVLVYSGQHLLTGNFNLPDQTAFQRDKNNSRLVIEAPMVSLGLSDTRGLKNIPVIQWDGRNIEFQQNSQMHFFKHGLHAPLGKMDFNAAQAIEFSLELSIDGIEQFAIVPIAKNNQVTLRSKWQHPQFFGRFLPSTKERKVDANGFSATWNISSLSSNAQQQLLATECCQAQEKAMETGVAQSVGAIDSFGVALIEPINIYSQSDRAIKYGILFVALSFAAFFLFEILKQLPIHPVQYALVGLALVLFFLLLVSLSEHIHFMWAYLIASIACLSLISFYLSYALRSWRRGLGFGAALSLLYGVLYGLLQSENNALVMGSILLFSVLASIMLVTRKVDWYQLGKLTDPIQIKGNTPQADELT